MKVEEWKTREKSSHRSPKKKKSIGGTISGLETRQKHVKKTRSGQRTRAQGTLERGGGKASTGASRDGTSEN